MAVPEHKRCSILTCSAAGVSFLFIEMRGDVVMRLRRCGKHTPSAGACEGLRISLGALRVEVRTPTTPIPCEVPTVPVGVRVGA